MSTAAGLRRSSRRLSAKVPAIKEAEPPDEDDEDEPMDLESESGSDFEEDLKKSTIQKQNGLPAKFEESSSSSSSADEDIVEDNNIEDVDEEVDDNVKKSSKLSRRNTKKFTMGGEKKKSHQKRHEKKDTGSIMVHKSLNLSESSSSDDNDYDENSRTPVMSSTASLKNKFTQRSHHKHRKEFANKASMVQQNENHQDHEHINSQLHALATRIVDDATPWSQASSSNAPDTLLPKEEHEDEEHKSFNREVADLLAAGETLKKHDVSDDSNEEEEHNADNNMKREKMGDVEITLEVPDKHKRKKKEFDMEAYLKREIGKAKREYHLVMHQANIVCLVGHLQFIHDTIRSDFLKAIALSVIPVSNFVNERTWTITNLSLLLNWFRNAIRITTKVGNQSDSLFPHPLAVHLAKMFETYSASSAPVLVLMFLLLVRSLRLKARLVLNFATVPLKPPKETSQENKAESPGEDKNASKVIETVKGENPKSTKNLKGEGKGSMSSKSKYFSEEKRKLCKTSESDKNSIIKSTGNSKNKEKIESSGKVQGEKSSGVEITKIRSPIKLRRTSARAGFKRSKKNASSCSSSDDDESKDYERKKRSPPNKKLKKSVNLSAKALEEAKARKKGKEKKAIPRTAYKGSSDEEEFATMSKSSSKKGTDKKLVDSLGACNNYWIEVCIGKKREWVCVDVVSGKVGCEKEMENNASKPMLYVLALNEDGSIKDVTRRYAKNFLTHTRKQRVDEQWLTSTLEPYKPKRDLELDRIEDQTLNKALEEAPMPTSVGAFKNHPLYVLPRHLLKFEGIYPADAPTLGFLKTGDAIYSRDCVHTLHCRVTWLKQGRTVKLNEEPYKIVKARPKYDRMSGTMTKDQPLELFGKWQTEIYKPPPAKDGKIPRNEYGNVELFKPWMLPEGTVHVPGLPGLNRIARKLNIDCAQAMMGWDYHSGYCHPVFDGWVVCKEHVDTLMDAWNNDADEKARKEEEKREKRVLDNWRKLVRGIMIAHKVKKKYAKDN